MILQSLRMLVIMTVLTGVAYPLIVTGISQAAFRDKANGSLIMQDGKVLGSALIGSKIGDDVTYNSPGGPLKVHVVSIDV